VQLSNSLTGNSSLQLRYSFASNSHQLNLSQEQSQSVGVAARQRTANATAFIASSKKRLRSRGQKSSLYQGQNRNCKEKYQISSCEYFRVAFWDIDSEVKDSRV
jgi:hypothetical protein